MTVSSAPRRVFALGVLLGVVLVLALRLGVNETPVADWLVSPLVRPDRAGPSDAIVVLGAGLVSPCVPNLSAIRRTMLAVRVWRRGLAARLLFTGGVPAGESCAVADVMADLAVELGVPARAIVRETASRSTHENATLSAPLLQRLGARRVLIVTDRLHVSRAAGAFRWAGFDVLYLSVPVSGSHPDNVSMLQAAARELVALGYYRARGWWRE